MLFVGLYEKYGLVKALIIYIGIMFGLIFIASILLDWKLYFHNFLSLINIYT
jgi:hypothetical protein